MVLVRNSILFFIAFMLVYSLMPPCQEGRREYLPLWSENTIKAERYHQDLHDASDRIIVIGASLSNLIDWAAVGEEFYDLTLPGLSIYDGLSIVEADSKDPMGVIIETNFALKAADKRFDKTVNSPVNNAIKRLLPVTRETRRPVDELGLLTIEVLRYGLASGAYTDTADAGKYNDAEPARTIALRREEYSRDPDPALVDRFMRDLEARVSKLEERGIRVVFLEMPLDSTLNTLPRSVTIRRAIKTHFPSADYEYVPLPEHLTLTTVDGLHLDRSSVRTYTEYLKEKLRP